MKIDVFQMLRGLHNDESGQDLIEYALAGSLIALAAVATMGSLGTALNNMFASIVAKV